MSLLETSCTIATGRRVVVSGQEATTGFPLHANYGSATRPSYSFDGHADTGLFMTPRGDMTAVVDGVPTMSISSMQNVTLMANAPVEQSGSGVLYIGEVVTAPTNAVGSGGLLFVDGPDLKYALPTGTNVSLTRLAGDVLGPSSASNNSVALFSDTTGKILKSANCVIDAVSVQVSAIDTPVAPAYSFVNRPTSGMFSSGTGEVAFSTGGLRRLHVAATGASSDGMVLLPPGSVNTPSVSFADGSGMFQQDGWVSFAADGDVGISVGPRSVVAIGSPPVVNGAGIVFIDQVHTAPTSTVPDEVVLWVDAGSLMLMSTVTVDLTNRIQGPQAATVDAVARFDGPSGRLVKNSTVTISDAGAVRAPPGTAVSPAYTFGTATATGVYSTSGTELKFTAQGLPAASVTDSTIVLPGRILCAAGSADAPGMSRWSDPDSGIYLANGTSMAVSCGGATCAVISALANVSLAGPEASSYGGGQGILFINQATVNPTTPDAGWGILYISTGDVNNLVFHRASGSPTVLTNRVCGPPSTTDRYVARFDDTRGRIITDGLAKVTNTGEFQATGIVSEPTYAFVGDLDTGLYLTPSTTLSVRTGGVASITISPLALVTNRVKLPAGDVTSPSLTFGTDTDTGIFQPGARMMTLVGGALPSLTAVLMDGASAPNITLGSLNVNYGGGEGVVLIEDVGVAPSGSTAAGGRLFVSGPDLLFHDYLGATINLQDHFAPTIGSVTIDRAVVRFDGTTGNVKSSAFCVNDPTALDYPLAGTAAAPTFSFGADPTSGVYWASSSALGIATAGVDRVVAGNTAVTVPTQPLYTPTLRVGGESGLTISHSGVITTQTVGNETGIFKWQQLNTPVLTTTPTRDLNTVGLQCTNASNVLSLSHTGTKFKLSYDQPTTGKLNITIGTNLMTTFGVTNSSIQFPPVTTITVLNRLFASGSGNNTNLDYDGSTSTRGLNRDLFGNSLFMTFGSGRAVYFYKNNCISWGGLGGIGDTAKGVIFIFDVASVPVFTTSNAIIIYKQTSSGVFGLGGRTNATFTHTVLDGARVRATITCTKSVVSNTSTNTDTGSWSVADAHGVVDTTTGSMYTYDDSVVFLTVAATWTANSTGYRRLSIMRKTAGPVYTELATSTMMAVDGDTTAHSVCFFGKLIAATDQLTIQVYQDSTISLDVSLKASLVRYDTAEV